MSEFIDALTGALIDDPVMAEDGQIYDRSSLTAFFKARRDEGEHIVSPQDGRTPMRAQTHEAPKAVEALRRLHAGGGGKDEGKHDESCTPIREPPAWSRRFKSLGKLREVFDVLDPLSDLLAETLEGWEPPVVISVGNETSGKSSLLERLCMLPLLPRGEAQCTRLPIVLKLRHTPAAAPPSLIVRDFETGRELSRRVVSVSGGEADVRREMEAVLEAWDKQQGYRSVCTSRVIEVHLNSPSVPSIDLIDLPGLSEMGAPGQDASVPEKTLELVARVIEQQHRRSAIYLLTISASMPPVMSKGAALLGKLGLLERTIGVLTMCDDVGQRGLRLLPGRLEQTSQDAAPLRPHGYVATMTEPVEEKELTSLQRLQKQAEAEARWFDAQPALAGLRQKGLATCDCLIDKINVAYLCFLRDTWAPQTIYRLGREDSRLAAENAAFGLPEAHTEEVNTDLERIVEIREAACDAAYEVLETELSATMQACHAEVLQPLLLELQAELTEAPGGVPALESLQDALLRKTAEAIRTSHALVARTSRPALLADTGPFKLGRFPRFVDSVVTRLEGRAAMSAAQDYAHYLPAMRPPNLRQLLRDASEATTDWVESCAGKRLRLKQRVKHLGPVKSKMLELLQVTEAEMPVLSLLGDGRIDLGQCSVEGLPPVLTPGRRVTFTLVARGTDGQAVDEAEGLPFEATFALASAASVTLAAYPAAFAAVTASTGRSSGVAVAIEEQAAGRYTFSFTPPESTPEFDWSGVSDCLLNLNLFGMAVAGSPKRLKMNEL